MLNDKTSDFIVGRLANFTNTAEGSLLPPPQKGQFRVPFVSGLQVLQSQQAFKATTFTLSWQDIISNVPASQALTVDHYNIYYTIPGDGTGQPIGPFSASKSPAIVTVPFANRAPVTFIVQTVLTNGMTSELTSSPTTTSFTNPTIIQASDINLVELHNGPAGALQVMVTWSNNSPVSGSIAWSAGSVIFQGISYPIAAGSTGTGNFWVYWALNNPNIFQAAVTPPNLDPFTQFIIAANANIAGTLGWVAIASSIEVTNGTQTKLCIQSGAEVSVYSGNNLINLNLACRMRPAASPVGVGFPGVIEVADATGTGSLGGGIKIIATGTDGKIQMATFQVNAANSPGGNTYPDFANMSATTASAGGGQAVPATVLKYINCTVDGTAGKIAVFSP